MQKYSSQEKILKLFANKRRLAILNVLRKKGTLSVGEIADKINLSLHATSKHLQLMETGGLVAGNEDGAFRKYSLQKQNDKRYQYMMNNF